MLSALPLTGSPRSPFKQGVALPRTPATRLQLVLKPELKAAPEHSQGSQGLMWVVIHHTPSGLDLTQALWFLTQNTLRIVGNTTPRTHPTRFTRQVHPDEGAYLHMGYKKGDPDPVHLAMHPLKMRTGPALPLNLSIRGLRLSTATEEEEALSLRLAACDPGTFSHQVPLQGLPPPVAN